MKQEFYYPSKDGLTQIHAIAWIPEGKVRGVLQIARIWDQLYGYAGNY